MVSDPQPAPSRDPASAAISGLRTRLAAWDRDVSDRIGRGLPHPAWFTRPFGLFSVTGNYGILWYVLAAIAAVIDGRQPAVRFAYVTGAVLATQGITYFVKLLVGRRRPVERDPEGPQHIAKPSSPSFPSSHASMSMVGFLTLSTLYPAWWPAFAVLALALVFSRVYLRVHYVLDVVAGLALGALLGIPFVLLVRV